MNINDNTFQEQQQQNVPLSADAENIDLNDILEGKPYTPVIHDVSNAFVDINNMGKYNSQPINSQLTQKQQALREAALTFQTKPNFDNAGCNLSEMNSGLSAIQKVIGGDLVSNSGGFSKVQEQQNSNNMLPESNVNDSSIDNTILTIEQAILQLQNVDSWIPESKKEYSKKLMQIGTPISNALVKYINLIKKMR